MVRRAAARLTTRSSRARLTSILIRSVPRARRLNGSVRPAQAKALGLKQQPALSVMRSRESRRAPSAAPSRGRGREGNGMRETSRLRRRARGGAHAQRGYWVA